MNFLDDLSQEHRVRLVEASTVESVPAGRYLLRRGEPGGDLFLVEAGQMQVVDTRTRPATIIAVMQPGDTIGEIAFVDHTPRSADVRAAVDSAVRHWTRDDVADLLRDDPALAAAFYEALCKVAVRRLRNLTRHAVSGAIGGRSTASLPPGARHAEHDATSVAMKAKAVLREVESILRARPSDEAAPATLRSLLDSLQDDAQRLLETYPDGTSRRAMATIWRNELHPWIVRSAFAERSLRRPRGTTGTPEILAHVLVGTPTGDGLLGELIDAWFLARPTLEGLRRVRDGLVSHALAAAPRHRGRRVLVVNAGTGSVVDGLVRGLADIPTALTVADPSRDALAFLDPAEVPDRVSVSGIREDLAQLAAGRLTHTLPPQDVIVVNDLLPYFPDRLAVSLLRFLAEGLAPGGTLVASSLAPSEDAALLDLLLDWPTIRRRDEALARLGDAAGLRIDTAPAADSPGVVVIAPAPNLEERKTGPVARAVASEGVAH